MACCATLKSLPASASEPIRPNRESQPPLRIPHANHRVSAHPGTAGHLPGAGCSSRYRRHRVLREEDPPRAGQHCYAATRSRRRSARAACLLDSRDGVRKGGESGPAIVPGNPDKSLLIKAVRSPTSLQDAAQGQAARHASSPTWKPGSRWAPRPARAGHSAHHRPPRGKRSCKDRRDWWSLQPVRKPAVPAVKDAAWSAHPVDRFLLAAWKQPGLQPAEPADRRTLHPPPEPGADRPAADAAGSRGVRRATSRRDAYEKLVDRLLASPHFGERWARHWIDVVRFSETHGNEWNYEVHHAWRYRDYLIRAFNEDVPYDQFVREHIAGDLLPQPRWNAPEQLQRVGHRHRVLSLRRGQPRRLHRPAPDRLRPGR